MAPAARVAVDELEAEPMAESVTLGGRGNIADRAASPPPCSFSDAAQRTDGELAEALIAAQPGAARLVWTRFAPRVRRALARRLGSTDLDSPGSERPV